MERRERIRYRRDRLFGSVRGRATIMSVTVAAVFLTAAVVLGMVLVRGWLESRASLQGQETTARIAFDMLSDGPDSAIAPRHGEARMVVQIVSADGRKVLAASGAGRGKTPLAASNIAAGDLIVHRRACPRSIPRCVWVSGRRVRSSPWGPGVMIVAAAPLPKLLSVWALPLASALLAVALIALVAWWTWYTIGRAFTPIHRIRRQLADLDGTDLDQRVFVPQTHGEIQALGEELNRTLQRLEEATNRERRFVSDASHDLRNPISGLHMQLELALDETGEEWRPMVRSALRDTERLNDIVIDLLELSRLDSRAPQPVKLVDLAELARQEVDRRPDVTPINARLEPGVLVRANPVRMTRVLSSLLSNAERHAESAIEVTVRQDAGMAILEVLDDGHGVPADQRERVFERFARLAESRNRDSQGSGLGLPIAREICEVYGGSLSIGDSTKGARFVMCLPLAEADESRWCCRASDSEFGA
ncbi:ATP-binding protein [Actinomadura sp. GTD37]|uniref:HAMP domain-containing sensor histidine kinase n=1 Tax=Actinomadura sp. GTD37 TaxID=1778030 RepID=UPI0035BFE2EA